MLQPQGVQRERRGLARQRREAFVHAPRRRHRVWQTDFSELETAGGGTWQRSGVVDYVGKVCLACPVTATRTWRDAVAALKDARAEVPTCSAARCSTTSPTPTPARSSR